YQQVGWSEMKDKVAVAIAGGSPPDVVRVSSAWGDLVADQGMLLDLRPYIERNEQQYRFSEFYPASVALWTDSKGRVYAFGNDLDMMGLFFNAELFDEAGVERPYQYNWDQWLEAAQKLTRDLDGDGKPDQYGFTNWWFHYITLVWANGGSIFTPDLRRSALGSPEAREALNFYRRFFELNTVATFDLSKAAGYPHSAAHFKAGKVAMAPAGSWMPNYWVWDAQKNQYNFDFDVAHMPLSYRGGRATSLEGSGYAIPVNAANKEDAFQFLAFITSNEWQSEFVTAAFPSRRPVAEKAFAGPQVPENRAVFLEIATYARPFPKGVEWQGRTKGVVLQNLGQFLTGQKGLEEVLTTIDEQLQPLLAELAATRK
ncbi:MAG: sugar ABC transporter substrate-binding protein, partial [Bacillota bacterium]